MAKKGANRGSPSGAYPDQLTEETIQTHLARQLRNARPPWADMSTSREAFQRLLPRLEQREEEVARFIFRAQRMEEFYWAVSREDISAYFEETGGTTSYCNRPAKMVRDNNLWYIGYKYPTTWYHQGSDEKVQGRVLLQRRWLRENAERRLGETRVKCYRLFSTEQLEVPPTVSRTLPPKETLDLLILQLQGMQRNARNRPRLHRRLTQLLDFATSRDRDRVVTSLLPRDTEAADDACVVRFD